MDKSEKKILTVIISIIIIFVLSITAVSYMCKAENRPNQVQITIGAARAIALEDAQADEKDVVFTEQESEIEHGLYAYEIEFNDGITKYKYMINAQDGKIISRSSTLMN